MKAYAISNEDREVIGISINPDCALSVVSLDFVNLDSMNVIMDEIETGYKITVKDDGMSWLYYADCFDIEGIK